MMNQENMLNQAEELDREIHSPRMCLSYVVSSSQAFADWVKQHESLKV